ncbi:MAG TPA: knotted carbamoyltransferase YgeW [Exilispira sp.]|nr:knotted carbamoyltransferase YgeW [Exilispira sp.]
MPYNLIEKKELTEKLEILSNLNIDMYQKDFLLTWEKSYDEILATFLVAEILRSLRYSSSGTRLWDSGLAVSIFKDNSTRTRFSFASACDLLGLYVQDLDEGKSQIAHGETVRETAVMVSFLSEVIGIRHDMFIGEGDSYMREFGVALDDAFKSQVIPDRPTIVNLQSDIDHPTQTMADFLHLINYFGGIDKLKGKKVAMSWAYSPSYGKPLSVPQGVIGLFTRFGMDVVLAYPEGYDLLAQTYDIAKKNANQSGGNFKVVSSMEEAFKDADIVYPKSWAPFNVMEKRVELLKANDQMGLKELEKQCLENNKKFINWECNEKMMSLTKNGNALYMHCLPADITDVSCKAGEVSKNVFEKYRKDTYDEASYKPYIIAAMILLAKRKDPAGTLKKLYEMGQKRILA